MLREITAISYSFVVTFMCIVLICWRGSCCCGCQVVKRMTRSMTGLLSRKQYAPLRDSKRSYRTSSVFNVRPSVFKLGEYHLMFLQLCSCSVTYQMKWWSNDMMECRKCFRPVYWKRTDLLRFCLTRILFQSYSLSCQSIKENLCM